jgi:DNA-binding MarR family transcriptional regulator
VLARAELVKPQSICATLAALKEAGSLVRSVDATDAPCRSISITATGRRILPEGRAARQNWLARAMAERLDGEQQRVPLAGLELLRSVVGS